MGSEVNGSTLRNESVKDKHLAPGANIARGKMAQRVDGILHVPLDRCRVWDARATVLPSTGATDDLGYYTGTLGSEPPSIQTGDAKTITATRYAGVEIVVPDDYEDGETFTIRLIAGMKTTVSDTTATIDVQAYLNNEDGTEGSDICATAAITINSLTAANKDFTITPATLSAGDKLNVRIAIAIVDGATATAVIGRLLAIKVLCDRR